MTIKFNLAQPGESRSMPLPLPESFTVTVTRPDGWAVTDLEALAVFKIVVEALEKVRK